MCKFKETFARYNDSIEINTTKCNWKYKLVLERPFCCTQCSWYFHWEQEINCRWCDDCWIIIIWLKTYHNFVYDLHDFYLLLFLYPINTYFYYYFNRIFFHRMLSNKEKCVRCRKLPITVHNNKCSMIIIIIINVPFLKNIISNTINSINYAILPTTISNSHFAQVNYIMFCS